MDRRLSVRLGFESRRRNSDHAQLRLGAPDALVIDYTAQCYQALARWLHRLADQ